jgi:hypothetical protein
VFTSQAGSAGGIINKRIRSAVNSSFIPASMKLACNYSLLGDIHIDEKAKL